MLQIQSLLANAPRENSTYRPPISQELSRAPASQELHMVPVSGNVHPHRLPPPVSAADLHRATTSELPGEPLGFHGPAPVQQEETFSVAAFVREVAR